jgi:hypothetical protein
VFNIHAHSFLIDANVASSPSMKAFKTALSDFKTEIVDVSAIYAILCDLKFKIYMITGGQYILNSINFTFKVFFFII